MNGATDFFRFQSIFRLAHDFLELSSWLDVCLNAVRVLFCFVLNCFFFPEISCKHFIVSGEIWLSFVLFCFELFFVCFFPETSCKHFIVSGEIWLRETIQTFKVLK